MNYPHEYLHLRLSTARNKKLSLRIDMPPKHISLALTRPTDHPMRSLVLIEYSLYHLLCALQDEEKILPIFGHSEILTESLTPNCVCV
jgi:uncharacterized protein (DUF1786 family)